MRFTILEYSLFLVIIFLITLLIIKYFSLKKLKAEQKELKRKSNILRQYNKATKSSNLISNSDLKYITTSPNNYLYKNVPYRTMDIFYECELTSDIINVAAEDEIQDLIWVKRSEIDLDKIGFVSIRKVIGEQYLK